MKNLSFEEFCTQYCDRMFEPRISFENQSSGYKLLREMVLLNITPATEKECERYVKHPTLNELSTSPDLKYLRFLHEILRPYIRENWNVIKTLKMKRWK